jgi:hypothetical protein
MRGSSRALLIAILAAGSLTLGGCASRDLAIGEAPVPEFAPGPETVVPAKLIAADAQIVECRLPFTIRRLGTQLVYSSPGRQMSTTARDCAVRGGEHIADHPPHHAT